MPNQSNRQTSADSDEVNASKYKTPKPSPTKAKPVPKNEKPSSGWFGGIFSKMGLRPKNQMKLPDDKNPSIVWDPEKKKWVNLDEDGSETSNEMKPPPKMSEILPKLQPDNNNQPGIDEQPYVPFQHANPTSVITQFVLGQGQNLPNFTGQVPYGTIPANPVTQMNPAGNPGGITATSVGDEAPKSTQPNMFKLQRGRNLKKSYVDVFNPNGKTSEQAMFLGATPSGNSQVNFFVPAPVNDPNAPVDFLTPANVNIDNSQAINHQLQ